MKPALWLALPWMALSRPARAWVGGGFAVLLAILVGAGAMNIHGDLIETGDIAHAAAFVDCFFWAGVVSQSLLLAREAHHLRLPALGREVCASLALYAALTIALPALLLAGLGGHAAAMLAEIALGAGLGMAYAVLPPYLGVGVCFVPMLRDHVKAWLPAPTSSPDGFLAWAVPCAVLLWLLIGSFWRKAVRLDYGLSGARRPVMLNLRTLAWHGRNRGNAMEAEQIRRRWRWAQPVADLRGAGPGAAVRNLRIAMGGWAMPLTSASRLRQFGILLASMLFPLAVLATTMHDDGSMRGMPIVANLLLFVFGFLGALLALVQALTLQRRWSRHNAELPLLALLPRIGDPARIKRELLRATVLPTLGLQALLALAILALARSLHLDNGSCVLLLLGQLAGAGMLMALALITLGGVRIHDGWRMALTTYGYLLVSASTMLALPLFDAAPVMRHSAAAWGAAALWAGLFVPSLRLCQRGWQAYRQRPHPFLANG